MGKTKIDNNKPQFSTNIDWYKAFTKSISEGFMLLKHPGGDIIDTNDALCNMLGYSHDELLSMYIKDIEVGFDESLNSIKNRINVIEEKGEASFETCHRCKGGKIIDVAVNIRYLEEGLSFCFHRDITEQKKKEKKEHKYLERAREALKVSDQRLNAVVDSISEVIIILDEDGRYIDILSGSEELLYNEREKIIGLLLHDVLARDIADARLNAIKNTIKTHKTQTIEYKLDVPAGERWFEGRISPLKSRGDKNLVVMVARDITEHKYLDGQIKESEGRYRTLIELGTNIGEAVIMLQDIDGREGIHAYVSDQWPIITGYSKEELLNMSFFDLVSSRGKEISIQRHRQKMAGKAIPNLFELSIIRKDGKDVPIEITSAVTISKGEPNNVVYIRDITERKSLEQSLEKERHHYRSIFENAPIALWEQENKGLKDKVSKLGLTNIDEIVNYYCEHPDKWHKILTRGHEISFISANKTFLALYEANNISEVAKLINKKYHRASLLLKDNSNEIYNIKQKIKNMIELNLGEGVCSYDDYIYTCKGNWKHIHCYMVRLPNYDNCQDQVRTLWAARDISDYLEIKDKLYKHTNRLEEIVRERTAQLKKANKKTKSLYQSELAIHRELQKQIEQRTDFTRALVHELKTPITPLLACSESLMSTPLDETQRGLVNNIHIGGKNLAYRVDELLDLAKGEVGLLDLKYHTVNPKLILDEVIKYYSPIAATNGLVLKLEVSAILSSIRIDRSRIQQVLSILMDNAIKYSEANGCITMRAHVENGWLQIEVRDTGIGISEVKQEKLFQPYKRFNTDKPQVGGLGLGLSLAKTLVELHGGNITFWSRKGIGSSFTINLPLKSKSVRDKT